MRGWSFVLCTVTKGLKLQIDFLGSIDQFLACLEVEIASMLINEMKVSLSTSLCSPLLIPKARLSES